MKSKDSIRHILIVDDSSTARMIIRRCLEITGFSDRSFSEAGTGQKALEIIASTPVDMVMTDLNMPGMTGQELVKKIRMTQPAAKVAIVVISSATSPAKELELKLLGADAVLDKPISPAKIDPLWRKK